MLLYVKIVMDDQEFIVCVSIFVIYSLNNLVYELLVFLLLVVQCVDVYGVWESNPHMCEKRYVNVRIV